MNVAVIGGSITEGAGASDYTKSYVYKLENYFEEKYDCLNLKNLGAGGTASDFALFRLKRDIGSFKPDVILVEFAVNDRIYRCDESTRYFEGLIRECSKYTDKIIIIDMPTGMSDACTSIHKKIAYFYNIPVIDVQDEVWKRIGRREFTWTKISVDNLHPNDKGHELYFDIIKDKLEHINLNELKINMDYRVLSKYKFNNPNIVAYDDEKIEYYGGWQDTKVNYNNKIEMAAESKSIEDGMIFRFRGKYLAMMTLLSNDCGIIECELDNYKFKIDLYSDIKDQFSTVMNICDLKNCEHTLVVRISRDKNEKSCGNKVVIGGFLVEES